MRRSSSWIILLAATPFLGTTATAQPLPPPKTGYTLERLSSFPLIHGRSPAGAVMSPDGSKIVYGWNTTGERRLDVYVMDFPSGQTRRILESSSVPQPLRQDDSRTELQKKEEALYDGGISNFMWSPDGHEILSSYRGRTWTYSPDGSNLKPLFDTNEPVSGPSYSPNGRYIAFLRNGNVFRWDRVERDLKQLTYNNKPGTTVDGFVWSPNSKRLAIYWSDNTRSGGHVMMDFTKQRAEVVSIGRMWNGDRSVNNQVGFVDADGGLITFVEGLPRYMWITGMDWSPDSSYLGVAWIKEDFQEFTLSVASPTRKRKWDAYTEKAPSNYIPDFRNFSWTRSGDLLFTTDIIDGKWANRSVMAVDPFGKNLRPVYAKNHDVVGMLRPKNSDRLFLVTMKRGGTITEITVLEPNGKETEHIVFESGMNTPSQFDDCSPPMVSEDGTKVATLANTFGQPNELYALEPTAKRLTNSQPEEFKKIQWATPQRVSFPGPDGRMIGATLLVPPGAKPGDKRPAVVTNIYANSGKVAWSGYNDNYLVMELGFVVLNVDFRASWGYGGEFNSGYYEKMGLIDADEAVKAKEYLVSLGYVNPDRVGIWGWSYGGFLTCMVMNTKPGVFDTGVAVASVTDWRQYNEWYTRRRIGMVSEKEDIFLKNSPVNSAATMAGNLYLVHGILDDNVLFQDVVQLSQKYIENGRHFDSLFYPRGDHGMWRDDERPHIMSAIHRYLYHKLTRPADAPVLQPVTAP